MNVLNKTELRKLLKKTISSLPDKQKNFESSTIWGQLERNKLFINSKLILCYWSMEDEIDTRSFINKWYGIKEFLLPSIKGNNLELKKFCGLENMRKEELYNISEPVNVPFTDYDKIDFVIVPGRAFDKTGNRMGRGKGFYDRILSSINAPKIGVCFKCQFFDSIETEEHDIPMDIVLHV